MKLNKKEKGDMLALIAIIVGAVIFVSVSRASKILNPLALGILSLIIQYLVVVPCVVKRYYKVNAVEVGFSRFIPIYNETMLFTPPLAIASIISWVFVLLGIASIFISPALLTRVFSEAVAFSWGDNAMRVTLALFIVNMIIRGIGYLRFMGAVNLLSLSCFGMKKSKSNTIVTVFQYCAGFIPVVQIIPLLAQLDLLLSYDVNGFKASDVTTEQKITERQDVK